MAGILQSEAYLRSSRWTSNGERPRESDYAMAKLKPLSPLNWQRVSASPRDTSI